jgi:hypothetical protein
MPILAEESGSFRNLHETFLNELRRSCHGIRVDLDVRLKLRNWPILWTNSPRAESPCRRLPLKCWSLQLARLILEPDCGSRSLSEFRKDRLLSAMTPKREEGQVRIL